MRGAIDQRTCLFPGQCFASSRRGLDQTAPQFPALSRGGLRRISFRLNDMPGRTRPFNRRRPLNHTLTISFVRFVHKGSTRSAQDPSRWLAAIWSLL
jgi:hypothetical protein